MSPSIKILAICFLLTGCNSLKETNSSNCNNYSSNDYSSIIEKEFTQITGNDQITYTELQYICVYSSLYINKGMFDRFGKWDKLVKANDAHLLIWNDIKLFEDSNKEYLIMTSGAETPTGTYTSVLVFDSNGKDLLSINSPEKEMIKKYFGELIRNNSSNKKDFYPVFWKEANPKKYNNIYGN